MFASLLVAVVVLGMWGVAHVIDGAAAARKEQCGHVAAPAADGEATERTELQRNRLGGCGDGSHGAHTGGSAGGRA